jgi:signal transduction histidine kinase
VHKSLEKNLPFIIDSFSNSELPIESRWRSALADLFPAYDLISSEHPVEKCQLNEQCNTLTIPSIKNQNGYHLKTRNNTAFFSDNDIDLVVSLLRLAKQFISIEDAVEQGAAEERKRIARDLHDDVAARMLTLIHAVKDQQTIDLSRSILKSLRNSIYTLDNKSSVTILDAITDARSELQDRLNPIGIQLFWQQSDQLSGLTFTPRQHINLNRMLHEAITNIIRHANAQYVEINIELEQQHLKATCCDNGSGFDIDKCIPGKGINNIKTRVLEIAGTASWHAVHNNGSDETQGSCVEINFPIKNTTT